MTFCKVRPPYARGANTISLSYKFSRDYFSQKYAGYGGITDIICKSRLKLSIVLIQRIDDCTDDSKLRKSFPTALSVYGPKRAWLTSNALVLIVMQKFLATNNIKVCALKIVS